MDINRKNTDHWKSDSADSVDYYNDWFLRFAPRAFKRAREQALREVRAVFDELEGQGPISAEVLLRCPRLVSVMRQMTCPPLARDRLAGLAGVAPSVVKKVEESQKWGRKSPAEIARRLFHVYWKLIDDELFSWLISKSGNTAASNRQRAEIIVADRLCGVLTDPVIRNEQERRQLSVISNYLEDKGYLKAAPTTYMDLKPGEFAFHLNIRARLSADGDETVNIPVDVAIQPKSAKMGNLPIIIEAKSAGDFTNVNKRRKEEAQKIAQLKQTYRNVKFVLFLCGYFDVGYLGYEASEGIDWIWEHRLTDMEKLGL